MGAILAEANCDVINLIFEFGDAVGISFQIRDDILGLFANEESLGKSNLSDMCEGKKTVLVSHFERVADEDAKKKFYSVYGIENAGEDELAIVRELLIESGSLDYAKRLCKEYTVKARELIDKMPISTEGRELLLGLLEYMTNRNN